MLIPLTENAVEPDLLSDKKTIEQLRKDEKNIPDRKEMTDLRERKLDRDRKELKDEKKEQEREKKAIEKEKEEIQEKRAGA